MLPYSTAHLDILSLTSILSPRMKPTLNISALEIRSVDAALNSQWADALGYNEDILAQEPGNVPALLRAGFATFQLKKYDKSERFYKEVLKKQPQNFIALDYIEKIIVHKEIKQESQNQKINLSAEVFIEHPGKTKSAIVSQLGQKNVLARLVVGEEVTIVVRKRHVEARNGEDEYIGILPDDIGVRLMYFFDHQSTYSAHIQEATLSRVVIFIRELSKGKRVERMASFPLDIPGSIAKVMAQQLVDDNEPDPIKKPETDDAEDPVDPDEKDNDVGEDLLNDLGGEEKQDSEEILGIETDDHEDEEE